LCVCVAILGFELRASCLIGAIRLESYLQPFLLWLFWRQGLAFCPGQPKLGSYPFQPPA
jgi:hypothetical protein